MSDRIHSFTVVLERDLKDDTAEHVANAIRQIRGVSAVKSQIANPISFMAETRAKEQLRERILKVLFDD